jgi:hypothetical protein
MENAGEGHLAIDRARDVGPSAGWKVIPWNLISAVVQRNRSAGVPPLPPVMTVSPSSDREVASINPSWT